MDTCQRVVTFIMSATPVEFTIELLNVVIALNSGNVVARLL